MRFIDESDNWNLFKLGEVLDKKGYIRGPFGSALKRGEMKKEGIPVYEQQHAIYNNRIFRYYIDNDKFQELKRFQVFPNDLIVSCSGTIGKTSLITNNDEKGIISQALLILRSNSNIINPKFLKYFLETNSGYNSLISSAGGSSQVNIAKKQIILDIPLLIPNLETQSKIISFLDLINNKIELLEEKHKYYQDFKKYLMQKLFAQELRFNFTDGWKIVKLETLIKKGKAGGTPSSTNLDYYNGDIPFLSIKDMSEQGKYIVKTEKSITNEGLNNSSAWIIPKYSLLYSIYASIGLVAINRTEISTSQAIYGIILKEGVSLEYMYYYLTYFKKNVHRYIETGTQGNLNAKLLKSFEVLLPSLKEQEMIVNILSFADEKIENTEKEIIKMNEFKKGLLQQMFVVQLILSLLQNKKHI